MRWKLVYKIRKYIFKRPDNVGSFANFARDFFVSIHIRACYFNRFEFDGARLEKGDQREREQLKLCL